MELGSPRMFAAVLAGALAVTLAGCGGGGNTTKPPAADESLSATPAAQATAAPPADAKVIRVTVTKKPAIILGDYAPKIPNPRVILSQVDINKGNKQVAHGINAVLLPFAP